jgi:hypothetical protein
MCDARRKRLRFLEVYVVDFESLAAEGEESSEHLEGSM